jgi:hypothetical protein
VTPNEKYRRYAHEAQEQAQDLALPRTKHPGSVSPKAGLISSLAPGVLECHRKLKRDRRCQVDSDPYGLPNWGRPLEGAG